MAFLVVGFYAISQEQTELNYFNNAAKQYYNGNFNEAKKIIDDGLSVYPSNEKLLKLKQVLGKNPKSQKWAEYNSKVNNLESQGYSEGSAGQGYISKTLKDPDGKQHVFVKKSSPVYAPNEPTEEDPWKSFNRKENSILSNGFFKGEGAEMDEKRQLVDPDGTTHDYFKKKRIGILNINASFKSTGQNKVQWSKELSENAESITIIFDNGYKKFTDDVSNSTNYLFESGDKDFDGVECSVYLKVVLKPNVKLSDKLKLKMTTHC